MHCLKQQQFLPITPQQAWQFFATPHNLNKITPPDMHFAITSDVPEKMYEGMLISYRIGLIPGIPLNWVTEITRINEGIYFVDEQRTGPYKMWHHEHHFEPAQGGVLMTDLLYYDIGKSVFGWLAGQLFVHRKVQQIFNYRRKRLEELFPKA